MRRERSGVIISLRDASFGYENASPLASNINLDVRAQDRVAIVGKNAAGKSSFFKALLQHPSVVTSGSWLRPSCDEIGFLDQNYRNLNWELSAFVHLYNLRPDWSNAELRLHLNAFLFRKNEEVMAPVRMLSGGERARLSLCLIAARSPSVLLLDEITNNIDTQTREHLISALHSYGGCLLLISHDEKFLEAANPCNVVEIGR